MDNASYQPTLCQLGFPFCYYIHQIQSINTRERRRRRRERGEIKRWKCPKGIYQFCACTLQIKDKSKFLLKKILAFNCPNCPPFQTPKRKVRMFFLKGRARLLQPKQAWSDRERETGERETPFFDRARVEESIE